MTNEQNPYVSPLYDQHHPTSGSTEYVVELPGFEGRHIVVQTPGFFSSAKLLIDGQPALQGSKRGQLLLRRNDGTEALVQLKPTNIVDPVPKVIVDGQTFTVAEPLKWYQYVWAGLPFALIFVGGLLGGLCGGFAMVINGRVFRSALNPAAKYLLTGLVTIAAAFVFIVLATAFTIAVRGR
jgi:hypothetical protein